MAPFECHLFVCCNQREPGHPRGCCDPEASDSLQKAFKKALAERGLNRRMRANRAGCLDQCEHGPNVVIYPEGIWYGGVTHNDVDEIVDSLVTGVPVARLRLADECINTAACIHRPGKAGRPDKPGEPGEPGETVRSRR